MGSNTALILSSSAIARAYRKVSVVGDMVYAQYTIRSRKEEE